MRCFEGKSLSKLILVNSASAVMSLCATSVWSAEVPDRRSAVREQDLQNKIRLQDTINKELNQHQRQLESEERNKKRIEEKVDLGESKVKFKITDIDVDVGSYPELAPDITDILKKYADTDLGQNEIFSLVRDVTNRYAEKGYSTTAIGIASTSLKQGKLKLRVDWGLVEGWKIDGRQPETVSERLMVLQAMPGVINKPLNIRDIDQAIENLNNTAKLAKVDIVPSSRTGFSFLNIKTAPNPSPSNTLGVDNSGSNSPSNGRYRYSLSSSFSDVLAGNDTLRLNGSSRRFKEDEHHSEYSAGVSYTLPIGYSALEVRYNDSYNSSRLAGVFGNYDSNGDSQTTALKLSHTLWRDAVNKLTTYSEFERKESENFLNGTYLEASSKRYDSFTFGLQYVTQLLGGSLYADMSLSHGMSGLGGAYGAFDEAGKPENYKKLSFNTQWSRPFTLGPHQLSFSSRMGGQYATASMLSSFKQSIGDEYSVRGFRGPALWGDRGVFIANTIELPMQVMTGRVSPYIGLDTGYVDEVIEVKGYAEDAAVAGAIIGVRGAWRNVNIGLSVAAPLMTPDFIEPSTDPYVSYITFGVSI